MKSQVEEYRQFVKSQISNDLSETISSLRKHHQELLDLISQLNEAKSQVTDSAAETRKAINDTFDDLIKVTIDEIEERRKSLLSQAQKEEDEAIEPLKKCETLLQGRVKEAKSRLEQGERYQKSNIAVSRDAVAHFQEDSASMTMLPEVPPLCTVPYISVQFPENPSVSDIIKNTINVCGSLSRIGPVQITTIEEKPGALFVNWEEVEDDDAICHEFKLECSQPICQSNYSNPSYVKVYEGKDFCSIVRDLMVNEKYLLRITSRQEGASLWSSWSLPMLASTSLPNFCWSEMDSSKSIWSLADGARLATKCSSEPVILFSKGAQLYPGASVLIEISSCLATCSDEGLGLCWKMLPNCIPICPGSLFMNSEGKIAQDGITRLTKLPQMTKGSKIILSSERISSAKIRISIEHCDKEVAYDWSVPEGSNGDLFFFANFYEPGWKIRLH